MPNYTKLQFKFNIFGDKTLNFEVKRSKAIYMDSYGSYYNDVLIEFKPIFDYKLSRAKTEEMIDLVAEMIFCSIELDDSGLPKNTEKFIKNEKGNFCIASLRTKGKERTRQLSELSA